MGVLRVSQTLNGSIAVLIVQYASAMNAMLRQLLEIIDDGGAVLWCLMPVENYAACPRVKS